MSPEEIAASALAGLDNAITTAQTNQVTETPLALPHDGQGTSLVEVAAEASARTAVDLAAMLSTGTVDAEAANVSHNEVVEGGNVAPSSDPISGTDATVTKPKRRGPKPKVKLPVEPRLIQSIPKRKEYANHTYSDFSIVPPMDPNYQPPTSIAHMSFVEKVHDILSKEEYEPWIAWRPHGRAFGITVPTMFEKVVCEPYFGHKRYSSFLRQINNHGFKHLTKDGPDRNCYYHESFLRGMMHLCKYMPEPKDSRRQIPDPDNEPDFEAISRLYPVPPPTASLPTASSFRTAVPPAASTGGTSSSSSLATILTAMTAPPAPKIGMDRDAALAEIQSLRARLAAEPDATSSLKRKEMDPLARMPQPFPTRAKKRDASAQMETLLQRNMIVATMRKEQEQKQLEEQLQQQQQQSLYPNSSGLSDPERLQLLQRQQQQQFVTASSNVSYATPANAAEIFTNPMNNPLYQRKVVPTQPPATLFAAPAAQWNPPPGLRSHPSSQSRAPSSANATTAANDLVGEYLRGASGTQHFS